MPITTAVPGGRKHWIAALLVPLTMTFGQPVHASSPDAWLKFQRDVERKCIRETQIYITDAKADVDPYGSESYGFATVSGQSKRRLAQVSFFCLYDKRRQTVKVAQMPDTRTKFGDEDTGAIERCGNRWKTAPAGRDFGPFMRECLLNAMRPRR